MPEPRIRNLLANPVRIAIYKIPNRGGRTHVVRPPYHGFVDAHALRIEAGISSPCWSIASLAVFSSRPGPAPDAAYLDGFPENAGRIFYRRYSVSHPGSNGGRT